MGFMDKIISASHSHDTTRGLFFGCPESEGEVLSTSRISLDEVYIDHPDVINDLNYEKFIVIGRKGTGKSALANYFILKSKKEKELKCEFIKKADIDLQQIVQIGKGLGTNIEFNILFQWVMLYKLIQLIIQNTPENEISHYKDLQKFINKNSGFTHIDSYKIKEFITKQGCEINIEYLKRYLSVKGFATLETKRDKAPFFELIPHLKQVVFAILEELSKIKDREKYFLFFDDLDNGYKADQDLNKSMLVELIRATKELNSFFGKIKNIMVKTVLLLRDDVKNTLLDESDMAKVFASYSTKLNWFDDNIFKSNENALPIKMFINKRIASSIAISKKGNPNNSWESFTGLSFKKLLDYTFYTPRDLLLYFNPITNNDFRIPLSSSDHDTLRRQYCDSVVEELKSLLGIHFDIKTIDKIFSCLRNYSNQDFYFHELNGDLDRAKLDGTEKINECLFSSSIIGHVGANNYLYFKHREKAHEPLNYEALKSEKMTLHVSIKDYFYFHKNSAA